jgi:hypothetical protein
MKIKWGIFIFILLMSVFCKLSEQQTLLEKLQDIPGITVSRIDSPSGYLQSFEIMVEQPLNHFLPFGETFQQRIFLSHISENAPMVLYHSGYGTSANRIFEPAALLNANQIYVTHRFFPYASPDPKDWQYLSIWQAVQDHHRIVELFKPLYSGKWISSGASKGGMTALFNRYFYPDDVNATIAYVAPIMFGTEDPRFEVFLMQQAGTATDRQKIWDFQRLLLSHRETLISMVESYAATQGISFPMGAAAAFEYSVLEYLFSFWQYGNGNTDAIPDESSSPAVWFEHLRQISPFSYYNADIISYYEPFYYQAYTELGYMASFYSHLQDLLVSVKHPTYRTFAPQNVEMQFNPAAMEEIIHWLRESGNRIIYIYGANDPYTTARVQIPDTLDALEIIQPHANHGVRIANLDRKAEVICTLENWLGINIDQSAAAMEKILKINRLEAAENRLQRHRLR